MAVRNIRAIGGTKPIPIIHAIPPAADAIMKLVIETDDGNIDLEDLLLSGSYSDGVTNTIGSFDFKIIDPDKTIYNQVNTFDEVVVYSDYGTEATTARFRGIIEKRGYVDSYLVISGRSVGMIFSEKNIIYDSDGSKEISTILTEIISQNFSDIDTSNIATNNTGITVNYYEIPMSQIIEELCGDTHDFYLNNEHEAHYFVKGSRQNDTEAIIEDVNLIETTDNADNSEETYTKVRVYGAKIGDIPIIATSSSDTTKTGGISKEYKIDNSSILTTTQATELANREFNRRKIIPKISNLSSLFLPTLLPGEKLFIGVPREEISPSYYEINNYLHEFDLEGGVWAKTTIDVTKQKQAITRILKDRLNFENEITENNNPNDMDFSQVIVFTSDSGIHTNTEVSEGYLKVKTGQSTGRWESDLIELSSDVTALEFRITGDYLVQEYNATSTNLWYSTDGGSTWRFYDTSVSQTTVPTGRDLKIRIDLNSNDSRVKAVAVFYKLS